MAIALRSLANSLVSRINPLELVTVRESTGYITSPDGTRVPTYTEYLDQPARFDILSSADLKLVEGLLQQGTTTVIYLEGQWPNLRRDTGSGGDTIVRLDGTVWLVTKVVEMWRSWTRIVATLQNGS